MSLSPTDRDSSVPPGEDFFRYANGAWIDTHPIPPGYGAWGAWEELDHRNEELLLALLEQAATEPGDDLDRLLGDYFAAGMDVERIEAAGIAPIEPWLDRVRAVASGADAISLMSALHGAGFSALWSWWCDVDHDDSTRHLLWLAQGGLGLPERDAYVNDSEAAVSLREAYAQHVSAQLANVGWATSDDGPAVLAFETRLAEHHLRSEQRRDQDLTLNKHSLPQLAEMAPGLALPAYLSDLGLEGAAWVNIEHPAYFDALAGIVDDTDVATLRAYLAFHVVRAVANALPSTIDDENFTFYGRRIMGQQEQKPRHKRVIDALGHDMGEALGRRFAERAFSPQAKERAEVMVGEILDQMRRSLMTRTWMGDQTRARALAKLDTFRVKIGFPDRWRDWSGLSIDRTSYAANRMSAAAFEAAYQLTRAAGAVDRTEWEMPAHLVNAYYHPNLNEIVFPAGILQPPFFDAEADDAVNYGAIGAVIAHEVTHGFDDQGRRFDESGHFSDWWTPEDQERFTALADRLVEQFDGYVAVDDVHVNGRLTLGENIADLGGVTLAYRALMGRAADAPAIDGLTAAQRFFLSWATVWRSRTSDELARTLAQVDPHSPRPLRATGPLANLDGFQSAFDLADDAPMLRAREERIEIW